MEQRIASLEKRVEKLEEVASDTKFNMIKDKYELKDIIREAVELGMGKIIEKMSVLEGRVECLEQKEEKQALCKLKEQQTDNKKLVFGVKSAIVGIITTSVLTFLIPKLLEIF